MVILYLAEQSSKLLETLEQWANKKIGTYQIKPKMPKINVYLFLHSHYVLSTVEKYKKKRNRAQNPWSKCLSNFSSKNIDSTEKMFFIVHCASNWFHEIFLKSSSHTVEISQKHSHVSNFPWNHFPNSFLWKWYFLVFWVLVGYSNQSKKWCTDMKDSFW